MYQHDNHNLSKMKSNIENLQKVIGAIKKASEIGNQKINDVEIARRINLSERQLLDLVTGKEDIPDNLIFRLLAAFNLELVPHEFVDFEHIDLETKDEE